MLKEHFSGLTECGTDEVGRGCLAGPVTAAAVILPKNFNHIYLKDSKLLSNKRRLYMRDLIIEKAIDYSIYNVNVKTIEKINILNSSFMAMNEAIKKLKVKPELILVDGNHFITELKIPFKCIVKGDNKYTSIAAASILAKTSRDNYMAKISLKYPSYNWIKNKGYPTREHKDAIFNNGITIHHRKNFKLI